MPNVATALVGGLRSLSSALGGRAPERISDAILYELTPQYDRIVQGRFFRFQFFPAEITDTKQVNYQAKEIPGGSLPIYQWVSSGERVVSFTTEFTCDVDLLSNPAVYQKLRDNGQQERNIDIRSACAWLRRYLLPSFAQTGSGGSPHVLAPRKVMLYIPNSGIGLYGGFSAYQGRAMVDSVICHMTQCDLSFESYFPSGLPRTVSVQLAFAQTAQYGGVVRFPGAELGNLTADSLSMGSAALGLKGYPLRPRRGPAV